MDKKLWQVIRPSMKDTTVPMFYYTFADSQEEAIGKVRMKWGNYDPDIMARVLNENELELLVIATNFFG